MNVKASPLWMLQLIDAFMDVKSCLWMAKLAYGCKSSFMDAKFCLQILKLFMDDKSCL